MGSSKASLVAGAKDLLELRKRSMVHTLSVTWRVVGGELGISRLYRVVQRMGQTVEMC